MLKILEDKLRKVSKFRFVLWSIHFSYFWKVCGYWCRFNHETEYRENRTGHWFSSYWWINLDLARGVGGKVQTKVLLKLVGIFIFFSILHIIELNSRFFDNTEYRYHLQTGEGKAKKDFLINRVLSKWVAFSKGMQVRKRMQYSKIKIIQMFNDKNV